MPAKKAVPQKVAGALCRPDYEHELARPPRKKAPEPVPVPTGADLQALIDDYLAKAMVMEEARAAFYEQRAKLIATLRTLGLELRM